MSKGTNSQLKERILLLTDIPPCKNYSGGLMSSQLVKMLLDEKHEVFCYSVMSEFLEPIYNSDIGNDISMKLVDKPAEDLSNSTKQDVKKYYNRIRKIEKDLIKYIRINNITKIWCPIQGEVIVMIMDAIFQKTKTPYVVQAWDSIEWWMREHKFDKNRENTTLQTYKKVMENATNCIVKSKAMAKKYKEELGITQVTIMPPINVKVNGVPIHREGNKEELVKNNRVISLENFTEEKVKQNFLKALDIKYDGKKKLNILEVNNIDLPGRRFNGFDLQCEINQNTVHRAKQIVTYKESDDKNVILFHESDQKLWSEWRLMDAEANELAVHSQLSLTSNILKNNDSFINADVVHYHLTHNTKLSLYQMIELCANKPSIWTFHDPWPFTGRCVHPQECEKWLNGCKNCNHISNLFPLKEDNCSYLWNLKKNIYPKLDIDIVITTPFMDNMIKKSPLTQCFKNVHLIPFGIDLNKFNNKMGKKEARKILKIKNDDIVLFFRAQMAMKGTEYIIEALKKLDCEKRITLLTCSETGLLEELKGRYNIIELGNIDDDKVITAYNACDIFLMPSRSESFGLMAIEAMACSRPIIIFNNSALPSVTFAPECGVLVENKNSDKLMEAIKYMIETPEERERRGALGRVLAEKHYDINKYHEKILKLYEDVYKRQKEKNTVIKNEPIDYSLEDVQILIRKLEIIYNKIFSEERLEGYFLKHKLKGRFDLQKTIDYSNESVQLILKMFNDCVYERWSKYDINKHETPPRKIEILIDLYKNDRPELLRRISEKFAYNRIVYLIARTGYRFIRGVKHIICKGKYNRQTQEINGSEKETLDLQHGMEIQEKKVQKIEENKVKLKSPKVTIIIPAYNASKYLREAIDSAIAQTYKNIEIIVINDGSNDKGKTEKIALSYGDKIRYIKKENGGVSTALNLGIAEMKGDYFSWLSHDDRYYPNKIEKQIDYLHDNNLLDKKVILYSDYDLMDNHSRVFATSIKDHDELVQKPEYSLLRGSINGLSLLIPKQAFNECGVFNEDLKCVQDYELWERMQKKYKFVHHQDVLVTTRLHKEQQGNTSPKMEKEGNEFWINLIKNTPKEKKEQLEKTEYNFLCEMQKFIKTTPYKLTEDYLKDEMNRIEEESKDEINRIKVSVIIPFYNRISLVINAIENINKQTHKLTEIILVNDGSTDSIEPIKKISKEFENKIQLISLQSNKGVSHARNVGIKAATGEYIAFLDSDDAFREDKIEKQLKEIYLKGYNFCHTSYLRKTSNLQQVINAGKLNGKGIPEIIAGCGIATPTVMIKKSYLEENSIYYNEKLEIGEDVCFYIEILRKTDILGIDEPLTIVNTNENSAAYNTEKQLIGLKTIIKYVLDDKDLEKYNREIGILFKEYIRVYDEGNENKILEIMDEYQNLKKSTSWRITKPLRRIKDVINLCKSEGILLTIKKISKHILKG